MIERLRIFATRILAVVLIALLLVSSSALKENEPVLSNLLFLIGLTLVAVATLGRLWCSLYIAGYKTDTLVTKGPYSMCRNPLYFFSLLGAVGVGLTTETVLIPAIILISFSVYYPLVIRSEEAYLLQLHGEPFSDYLKRVPRFFPDVSKFDEPKEYIVKPIVFREHMSDAIWFILIVGLLKVNAELHNLGVLPSFFHIY